MEKINPNRSITRAKNPSNSKWNESKTELIDAPTLQVKKTSKTNQLNPGFQKWYGNK